MGVVESGLWVAWKVVLGDVEGGVGDVEPGGVWVTWNRKYHKKNVHFF